MRKYVIAGTGTDVGKTLVASILCYQHMRLGRKVAALKPVVSGFSPADPLSDPALLLRSLERAPTPEHIAAIAPWRFSAPLSPHLAAALEHREMHLSEIVAACRLHGAAPVGEVLLVETAGGVMTPLNATHTVMDMIVALGWPVILVAGNYLGALSHTLTALYVLKGHAIPVKGIVVSETTKSTVSLSAFAESLQRFTGPGIPVHTVPRLHGKPEAMWVTAPSLVGLCT